MRTATSLAVISLLLVSLLTSCSDGNKLTIVGIHGPDRVAEDSTVEYSIDATGDSGISYSWAVSPPHAGVLTNPSDKSVTFTATRVSADLPARIEVVLTSPDSNPVVRIVDVTILDVQTSPPVAAAHAEAPDARPGFPVQFFNDSTDPNGDEEIIRWSWDFSYDPVDGFNIESTEINPIHEFAEEGLHQVQLRVTDLHGSSDMLDTPLLVDIRYEGWVRIWGGRLRDQAFMAESDSFGNIYVTGKFFETVDFDPGPGVDIHEGHDNQSDPDHYYGTFLTKYNPQGDMEWTITWRYGVIIIDLDVSPGGIVSICGFTYYAADFDPGPGETCPSDASGYVARYSSDGEFENLLFWQDFIEQSYYNRRLPLSLDSDEAGRIYVVLRDYLSVNYVTDETIYLLKLDPDAIDSTIAEIWRTAIYYGYVDARVKLTPSGEAYIGIDDYGLVHLLKFDYSGNETWAFNTDTGLDNAYFDLALDSYGNAYITGMFEDAIDFDPGPGEWLLSPVGERDTYLSKYDPSGNLLWALDCASQGDAYLYVAPQAPIGGIDVSDAGDILVTGVFTDEFDFDPGPDEAIRSSKDGALNSFVSSFDPDGNFNWVGIIGYDKLTEACDVAAGIDGNVYVVGGFLSHADFDPGLGISVHYSNGAMDAFLTRILPDGRW